MATFHECLLAIFALILIALLVLSSHDLKACYVTIARLRESLDHKTKTARAYARHVTLLEFDLAEKRGLLARAQLSLRILPTNEAYKKQAAEILQLRKDIAVLEETLERQRTTNTGLAEAELEVVQDELEKTSDALEQAQELLHVTNDELSSAQGALQAMTALRYEFARALMEAKAEINQKNVRMNALNEKIARYECAAEMARGDDFQSSLDAMIKEVRQESAQPVWPTRASTATTTTPPPAVSVNTAAPAPSTTSTTLPPQASTSSATLKAAAASTAPSLPSTTAIAPLKPSPTTASSSAPPPPNRTSKTPKPLKLSLNLPKPPQEPPRSRSARSAAPTPELLSPRSPSIQFPGFDASSDEMYAYHRAQVAKYGMAPLPYVRSGGPCQADIDWLLHKPEPAEAEYAHLSFVPPLSPLSPVSVS